MAKSQTNTAEVEEVSNKQAPKVRFNTTNLKSSYANVCNVTSTREEVVLNFGINQNWEQGVENLIVELTDRIILSPFAAKRLTDMMVNLMSEYDKRYGTLSVDNAETGAPEGVVTQ